MSTRRSLLAGAVGAGATAVLAACGGGSTDDTGTAWSYTDATGKTVRLGRRPTRIAGFSDAIASLWAYGIKPVAVFGYVAMKSDPSFDGIDTAGVTEVGRTYGEIDLEALAAARPDLIVTHVYPKKSGQLTGAETLYGFADKTQIEKVNDIAPVVAIAMMDTADVVINHVNALAVKLGVPRSRLAKYRAEFEKASDRVSAAAKKGLSVMAEAAYADDGLYIAKPADDPALGYYAKLGVDVPNPGSSNYYWRIATWEQVDRYRTDVILNSTRAMSIPEVLKQPTFAALPAAKAKQVYPWHTENMDYVHLTRNLNQLAGWLDESHTVT